MNLAVDDDDRPCGAVAGAKACTQDHVNRVAKTSSRSPRAARNFSQNATFFSLPRAKHELPMQIVIVGLLIINDARPME